MLQVILKNYNFIYFYKIILCIGQFRFYLLGDPENLDNKNVIENMITQASKSNEDFKLENDEFDRLSDKIIQYACKNCDRN